MTRLLLVSNVHGDELFLSHVLQEGRRSGVEGVLACGDLGGDRAWPVHPEADERDRAFFERRGFMPFEVGAEAFDSFSQRFSDFLDMRASAEDVAFLDGMFKDGASRMESSGFRARSFSTVVGVLERFASGEGLPVFAVLGSADVRDAPALLSSAAERTPLLHAVHGASAAIGELAVVGLGRNVASDGSLSVPSRFSRAPASFFAVHHSNRPRRERPASLNELSEREAHGLLERAYRQAGDRPVVLTTHSPPFASGADLTVTEGGQVHATGSSAVRQFALRPATVLVHTGQVRACSGVTRVGTTVVVNTGQLAALERPLYNVRNVVDEVATTYVPVSIWEPVGGMAAIAEVERGGVRASPVIVTEHVETT